MAIELCTAAQALNFRKPMKPGRGVQLAHDFIRSLVPYREKDFYFEGEITECLKIIRNRGMIDLIDSELSRMN